jgi:hypothetical protein
MGKRVDKDYKRIRQQVARASELMAAGMSEAKAAQKVGLPRSSLQRYLRGKLPGEQAKPASSGCPQDEEEGKRIPAASDSLPTSASSGRDPQTGKFLPGHADFVTRPARIARSKLEEFCPQVAERLVRIFEGLPDDRPDLILAYAKEILDRAVGKPAQSLNIQETHVHEQYAIFEAAITNADVDLISRAADIAHRMEEHARIYGGAPQLRQVEIIPPPGGSLFDFGAGSGREVSKTDNHDASATR